ncbi:MAG: MBL fold metallo-hydrolase [Bacillota bacterium]
MQLTVLGCFGPFPGAGGACSGYLLKEDGCNLLIDCGNGVFSRLQEHLDYREIDAVMLSHLHPDHISDLMVMRYALAFAEETTLRNKPLPVYALPEPEAEFERLPYQDVYEVNPLQEEKAFKIGPFTIETVFGVHSVPSLAMRFHSQSGIFVYSGDTEYHPVLEEFAAGADLFLCEANFRDIDIEEGFSNHLSASQAAQIASEAKVKRLLLTHHYPENDQTANLAEAEKHYPEAELAREGESYEIKTL